MRQKTEETRRRLLLWLSCWCLAAVVLCSQSSVTPLTTGARMAAQHTLALVAGYRLMLGH